MKKLNIIINNDKYYLNTLYKVPRGYKAPTRFHYFNIKSAHDYSSYYRVEMIFIGDLQVSHMDSFGVHKEIELPKNWMTL